MRERDRKPPARKRRLRRARALHEKALRLTYLGKYRQAEAAFRCAISLAGHGDSERALLAALLNDFGVLSKYAGRYARARKLYAQAQKQMPLADPRMPEFRATLFHNLAGLEHARGRYARALAHAREGIRLRRRIPGRDRLALAADQAALAAILVDVGRLREAETIQLSVLRFYRRRFGTRHYQTAALLANLGALYAKQGRLAAAEQTLRRASRALERVLGKNHPRLAAVTNNLATVRRLRANFLAADATSARTRTPGRRRTLQIRVNRRSDSQRSMPRSNQRPGPHQKLSRAKGTVQG